MKSKFVFYVIVFLFLACKENSVNIDIVASNNASEIEKLSAHELQSYLSKIYPDYSFAIRNEVVKNNRTIRIGTVEHLEISQQILDSVPDNAEGFLVTMENPDVAVITSKGESGLLFGVHQLLEKLGCRFLLDTEYLPSDLGDFEFNDWYLKNEPLISERYANPWEVYLEGCSSWDLDKWKQYIRNVQKIGFNSILVHAYGNDPMFTFDFNGKTKPIGHLTSSEKGRGWGQKHINDVRRIPGGNSMFTNYAFGAERALVPDQERAEQSQRFMGEVFSYANERGLKVNFALDFDILSNIPQELVKTLPETDRFIVNHKGIGWMGESGGDYWIPRPDTFDGNNYYTAQVKQLLNLYPDISTFTMWRRRNGTILCELKYEELPDSWKIEYNQFTTENPGADKLPQSVGTFVQRKLAIAYKNIFKELGREDIKLAIGTWHLNDLDIYETLEQFIPEDMKIIILDSEIKRSEINLKNREWIDRLSSIIKKDRYVPIIWAHHDDGEYIGSPFKEFDKFYDLLKSVNANSFGVIHWINRPLDLFFINHNRQVWKNSQNETAEASCQFLTNGIWYNDTETANEMGKYLLSFWHDFPPMSRANTAYIFDKPISDYGDPDSILLKIEQRRANLKMIKTDKFSENQKEFINFQNNYELFLKMLIENQLMYEEIQNCIKLEKWEEAKSLANKCYPEETLKQLAKTTDESFVTNGDMGLLFSLGVRWLPHFISIKQQLAIEPVSINFGTTKHEKLAQMPGKDTYFIDTNDTYWKVLGEKETGRKVVNNTVNLNEYAEIFNQGVVVNSNMDVRLNTLTGTEKLIAGKYTLQLLVSAEETSNLIIETKNKKHKLAFKGSAIESIGIVVDGKSTPEIKIYSQEGTPVLCGLVLKKN